MADEQKPKETYVVEVRLFEDKAGEWRWRGMGGNYEEVAQSSEGYKNKDHAREQAKEMFPDAMIVDESENEQSGDEKAPS